MTEREKVAKLREALSTISAELDRCNPINEDGSIIDNAVHIAEKALKGMEE